MKRNHKIAILSAALCVVMALGQGCTKWLDTKEFDKIPYPEFWQTREDVSGIVSGAYTSMRNSNERIFLLTEVRGDGVEINMTYDDSDNNSTRFIENYNNIKDLEIQPDNDFVQYSELYRTIGRCNQVIEYSRAVLDLDETFTVGECESWIAEMKWLRCLCYFYLVRAYWDVPYVTWATMDDSQNFAVEKTEGRVILQKLIAELEEITAPANSERPGTLPPVYPVAWEQRGRATTYAGFALLADIHLWLGNYDEVNNYCEKIFNVSDKNGLVADPLYELAAMPQRIEGSEELTVANAAWFNQLFGTSSNISGNSSESIFELQWDAGQTNSLYGWLQNANASKIRFYLTQKTVDLFSEYTSVTTTQEVRGAGATFVGDDRRAWKYVGRIHGLGNARPESARNANLMIYRLADIYLMKAEALIMLGGDENYEEAYKLIRTIRFRAGNDTTSATLHPMFQGEADAVNAILKERQLEFTTECKRWFDLARFATREDGRNQDAVLTILLKDLPASKREVYRAKLQNDFPYAYFFPIHEEEIDASGGVLKQNPYYD